jgi:hypothetical protein
MRENGGLRDARRADSESMDTAEIGPPRGSYGYNRVARGSRGRLIPLDTDLLAHPLAAALARSK